jgi:hypothetical protein
MTPIEKKVSTKKITRKRLASPIAPASLPEASAPVPSESASAIDEGRDEPEDELRKALPDLGQPGLRRAWAGIDVVGPEIGEDERPDSDEDVDEHFDCRGHRQNPA